MDNQNLTLKIDFTGCYAGSDLGYLTPGLHVGQIVEFAHYEDSGRLYAYMITDGVRHRESFSIKAGQSFLMRFLVSAGVPKDKVENCEAEIPFSKLSGRNVYFNYTPPATDESGKKLDNSWPKYTFYPQSRWDQMRQVAESVEVVESAPSNGGNVITNAKQASPKSGDFDFLLEDSP